MTGETTEKKALGKGMRIGAFALAAVLAFAWAAFAMTGCSSSEQVIRDGVAEQLDHYKNADATAMEEAESAIPSSQAEALGIDPQELGRSLLEGFDYTIDSVAVNGDTAEAVVTVTCKSMAGLEAEITSLVQEAMDDPSIVGGTSTEDIYHWVGSKIMEYVANEPAQTREPIAFDFIKEGSNWEPTDSAQKAMSSLFLY